MGDTLDGLSLDDDTVAAAVRAEQLGLLAGRRVDLAINVMVACLVTATIGGMMAGGIVGNAVYLPAKIAFLVPIMLPCICPAHCRTSPPARRPGPGSNSPTCC